MALSEIGLLISTLTGAKQLAQAALDLRDFNAQAAAIAKINGELLKAQDQLFVHQSQLLQLQEQHFEAREELRKLKEAQSERQRYSLFDLGNGQFVYRVNIAPEESGAGDPTGAEPLHYLCQPCFDGGVKSVLQKLWTNVAFTTNHEFLACSICNAKRYTGGTKVASPRPAIRFTNGFR